jgi:hypothetical protein
MNPRRYEMALLRDARSHLTLEGLASSAGIHPGLVERLLESGLVEPVEWAGARPLFDVSFIPRLCAVQCENDLLRSRL